MFLLLVFLHVATMFIAVAASYGPTAMFLLAVRSNRVESVNAVGRAVGPVVRWIPVLFGVGALFGVLAALVVGYNLLAPWLVISYVLFVIASVIGAAYTNPFTTRFTAAIGSTTEGPLPPAAAAMVRTPTFIAVQLLDFATIISLIAVMVFKPFS
jgi:uncharacterized membrane protein